ncbi:uncharacterized protein LOC119072454 [Bradysia coprophila]|uniref:uncharacterized protein LOC119072454 n=1 Tax=Bradysia coprophila TaxID=38358 RepID=UPI00187D985E|nr:uncharacterized protein LOC119072454 [Bradysia coprophila]XP_037033573.1 uncharacterized protein LOC119072454 [Bradysia coprophila]
MDIELQDQIYIVSAALVVVTVVLLIFCITLCVSIGRLKKTISEQNRRDVATRESKYAYNNPSIQPDEELHHRGYLMHQGQIVPRVMSTSNGGYSTDPPRKPTKPNSRSSRDFIPINDRNGTKDASKDFRTVLNPNSSVFDDDVSYNNESQPVSSKVPITVNNVNSNRYTPPRPSQFNSNITLGQNQTETRQEGVTYFNNRAIDY